MAGGLTALAANVPPKYLFAHQSQVSKLAQDLFSVFLLLFVLRIALGSLHPYFRWQRQVALLTLWLFLPPYHQFTRRLNLLQATVNRQTITSSSKRDLVPL